MNLRTVSNALVLGLATLTFAQEAVASNTEEETVAHRTAVVPAQFKAEYDYNANVLGEYKSIAQRTIQNAHPSITHVWHGVFYCSGPSLDLGPDLDWKAHYMKMAEYEDNRGVWSKANGTSGSNLHGFSWSNQSQAVHETTHAQGLRFDIKACYSFFFYHEEGPMGAYWENFGLGSSTLDEAQLGAYVEQHKTVLEAACAVLRQEDTHLFEVDNGARYSTIEHPDSHPKVEG